MRIVTGNLRGRQIHLGTLGNVRITSSRLKEAIFSMIGSDLQGIRFLDLCAGSGQIGLEALSRGAEVVFNEPNRKRNNALRNLINTWHVKAKIFDRKGEQLIAQLTTEQKDFDIIYLDPPYHQKHAGQALINSLLKLLSQLPLLKKNGYILAQHQSDLELPQDVDALTRIDIRQFGANCISIYTLS